VASIHWIWYRSLNLLGACGMRLGEPEFLLGTPLHFIVCLIMIISDLISILSTDPCLMLSLPCNANIIDLFEQLGVWSELNGQNAHRLSQSGNFPYHMISIVSTVVSVRRLKLPWRSIAYISPLDFRSSDSVNASTVDSGIPDAPLWPRQFGKGRG